MLEPSTQTALGLTAFSTFLAFIIYRSRSSGLGSLPGPPSQSWLWGNLPQLLNPAVHSNGFVEEWVATYGTSFSVHGFLSVKRLYTVDPKTIGHILSRSSDFPKPWQSIEGLRAIAGEGVIAAEGEVHKRQRKILNPVFSPAQVRMLTPLFIRKAEQLCEILSGRIAEAGTDEVTFDMLSWLSRATLDVIGEGALGYNFNAIKDENNEFARAFSELFKAVMTFDLMAFIQLWFPVLNALPTSRNKSSARSSRSIREIGMRLISSKKQELDNALAGAAIVKGDVRERDLLSVLIKANLAEDLPESQRMSTEEILSQIITFTLAGHETSATGLTWFLFAMAEHQDVQTKLREELLAFPHNNPTMEELNSLEYLDWALKESMRVHSPVTSTSRSPLKDEMLPISEPFLDDSGTLRNEIHMKAGDVVFIPIASVNMSTRIWGQDAKDFRPDRWRSPPEEAAAIPSVYANLLTFLSGPRACIGWRMAIIEQKAFIFALLRMFRFDIDPSVVVEKRAGFAVTRPVVIGELEKGNQLPLKVSLVRNPIKA